MKRFYIWHYYKKPGKYFNGKSWGLYKKRKLYKTLAAARAARGKHGGLIVIDNDNLMTS